MLNSRFSDSLARLNTLLSASAIIALGAIMGFAYADSPFDYDAKGIEILDYELDYETMAMILDVDVADTAGTLQITFEREFFDSKQLVSDDKFIIIAEGDLIAYNEIKTTKNSRTIEFNLNSGIELVEIFGTHLDGFSIETEAQINEQGQAINQLLTQKEDLESEKNELAEKVTQLKSQNEILKVEKEKSDVKIFDAGNLVSAVEKELTNVGKELTNVGTTITEQFTSFVKWVTPK